MSEIKGGGNKSNTMRRDLFSILVLLALHQTSPYIFPHPNCLFTRFASAFRWSYCGSDPMDFIAIDLQFPKRHHLNFHHIFSGLDFSADRFYSHSNNRYMQINKYWYECSSKIKSQTKQRLHDGRPVACKLRFLDRPFTVCAEFDGKFEIKCYQAEIPDRIYQFLIDCRNYEW